MNFDKLLLLGLCLCGLGVVDAIKDMRCHEVPLNISIPRMRDIDTTCYGQLKDALSLPPQPPPPGTKEFKKIWKLPCFQACVWEQFGVLANGAVSPNISAYASTIYPPSAAPAIADGAKSCAAMPPGLSKDDNCSSYKNFTKCFKDFVKAVCKGKPNAAPPPTGRRRRGVAPEPSGPLGKPGPTPLGPTPDDDRSSGSEE